MFQRILSTEIKKAAESFYAISVVGPRQSGKTTLLKHLFGDYHYLNLEEPDILEKIRLDPRGFFQNTQKKWIIDEAQEYPELFSFLLGFIDQNKIMGQFILSGSKNFILLEKISQSLAGRIAILELMPLSYPEFISEEIYKNKSIWEIIYQGTYPGPYSNKTPTDLWYKSYVTTYLQRDVRQIIQIKDLSKFHLFLKLCAGRHGQLINFSDIGSACGVSHTTIAEWLNILELSYITFRLQPYYKNFNKRLVKTPKLYFYDPGLVCHLLGIESPDHAQIHEARGALFEGYIISEIAKLYMSHAKTPPIYFWNINRGFEIDLLVEKSGGLCALEIKSSATFSKDFFKQLNKWKALGKESENSDCFIVYSGDTSSDIQDKKLISYKTLNTYFP
jgi:predicted AAA+ superfamily ATPase